MYCSLRGPNLMYCSLRGPRLMYCSLRGPHLMYCSLRGPHLMYCSLRGPRLMHASCIALLEVRTSCIALSEVLDSYIAEGEPHVMHCIFRYDPLTGKFTADRPGLYYFQQEWKEYSTNHQKFQLRKNGDWQCVSQINSGSYLSSSCGAVMELVEGDEIFVTSDSGLAVHCPSCTGFTGFIITPYI